jgi:hypothetical protein
MNQSELRSPPINHRVVGLAVHGIGEQPLGNTLKHVLSGFLPLVRLIDPDAGISASPLDKGDPSEVAIRFRGQSDKTSTVEGYEITFKEAWWASTFEPPSIWEMVGGMPGLVTNMVRRRGVGKTQAVFWVLSESLKRFLTDLRLVILAVLLTIPALVFTLVSLRGDRAAGGGSRLLETAARGQTAIAELAVILASPFLLLVVLVPLRVIEFLLPTSFRIEGLGKFRMMLTSIITRHLGDMWLYLNRPWEASRIRVRVEERFRELVDEITNQAAEGKVECVLVVAHSMGAVVTYEALTGRRMTDLINANFGGEGQPKLFFATVGAGLNLAWQLVPRGEERRFVRPVSECVEWHDFWSELDPVPRGKLMPPARLPGPSEDHNHEVVNQMDVFSDHTAYWNNAEEVVAPLLDLATDHHFDSKLCLNNAARRTRVQVLAAFKGLAWVMAPISAVAVAFSGGADWISDQIVSLTGIGGDIPSLLGAAGAATAGAAIVVVVYSTIVKWFWNLWDNRVKYKVLPAEQPSAAPVSSSNPTVPQA